MNKLYQPAPLYYATYLLPDMVVHLLILPLFRFYNTDLMSFMVLIRCYYSAH